MMLYQTGNAESERVLSWGDLETENSIPIGSTGKLFFPRVSPDGSRCIVEVQGESQEGGDLWVVDLATGLRTRFTFEEGDEVAPCWTPDGETIVYTSRLDGLNRIMERPVEGTGGAVILYEANEKLFTTSVHPDGNGVLFAQEFADSIGTNLEFLSFDGDGTPAVVLPSEGYGGRYSPDGRWIAYGWGSAGVFDVFVMPTSGGTRKWQITTGRSVWPQWQPDGSRLFVQGFGGEVIAYEVEAKGNSFRFGPAAELMTLGTASPGGVPFSIHPDGKRIVLAGPDPSQPQADFSPIHLVTDWRRAPTR